MVAYSVYLHIFGDVKKIKNKNLLLLFFCAYLCFYWNVLDIAWHFFNVINYLLKTLKRDIISCLLPCMSKEMLHAQSRVWPSFKAKIISKHDYLNINNIIHLQNPALHNLF